MFNALQHINTKSTMLLKTLFDFSGTAQKDTLFNPTLMYHYNVQTDDKPCPSEWSYQRLQGRILPLRRVEERQKERWLLYLWFGGTLSKQVPKQVLEARTGRQVCQCHSKQQ